MSCDTYKTSKESCTICKYDYTEEEFTTNPKGLYLWGDGGCGKTMLIGLLYLINMSFIQKKKTFPSIYAKPSYKPHKIISKHGKSDIDPIPILVAKVFQNAHSLCFEDFQVTDAVETQSLRLD